MSDQMEIGTPPSSTSTDQLESPSPAPLFFVRPLRDETLQIVRRKVNLSDTQSAAGTHEEDGAEGKEEETKEDTEQTALNELRDMRKICVEHFVETMPHAGHRVDDELINALEYLWLDSYLANPQVVVMVLENMKGICGYAFGIPSVSQHAEFVQSKYLPAVWDTVSNHLRHESSVTIMDLCESMTYSTEDNLDPFLSAEFPGFVQVGINSRAYREGQTVRLTEAIVTQLHKLKGVASVHASIPANDLTVYQGLRQGRWCELWRTETRYVILGHRVDSRRCRSVKPYPPSSFQTGVMEGFYNRPWSASERSWLFEKLGQWDMRYYMYAPKDDAKHRASWREWYTKSELDELQEYNRCCEKNNAKMIYAIAPGLDISYSSPKDREILREKVAQVADVGITHFAVLFDDIEPNLSHNDYQTFGNVAAAQASVANMIACEIFKHLYLHQKMDELALPEMTFFFCPTEYCNVMAKPSVTESEYLEELGRALLQEVEIFWTGPLVVSPHVTEHDLKPIALALQRPIILWDNLHANDYDAGNRVYLGPFSGRDPHIRKYCKAVISNPNCSLDANFVPLRTLSLFGSYIRHGKVNLESPNELVEEVFLQAISEWYDYMTEEGSGAPGASPKSPVSPREFDLLGGISKGSVNENYINRLAAAVDCEEFTRQDLTVVIHQHCLPFALGISARMLLLYVQCALILTDFDGEVSGRPVITRSDQMSVLPCVVRLLEKCGVELNSGNTDPDVIVDIASKLCKLGANIHGKLPNLPDRGLAYALSPYVSTTSARLTVASEYIRFASQQQAAAAESIRTNSTNGNWDTLYERITRLDFTEYFPQPRSKCDHGGDTRSHTVRQLYSQTGSRPLLKHMFFMAGPVHGSFLAALDKMIGFEMYGNGFRARPFEPEEICWYLHNGHEV
eukprot:gb/GECG01010608.1/.p1 GENE.gb/GECG01010608.1/~~gb/GECG01010608.1/.p1  ORF type:complete len:910 (+),score=67.04 gb/GECG01010608.1/:1-2730(+)